MILRAFYKRLQRNWKRRRRLWRFDHQAKAYFEKRLQPSLGMSAPALLTDHYARKKYAAFLPSGKVFIKLYRGKAVKGARRYVAVHPLLSKYDVRIPELIAADTGAESLRRYNLGSVVLRWVEGKTIAPGNSAGARAAFANLGKLHCIGPSQSAEEKASGGNVTAPPLLTRTAMENVSHWMLEAIRLCHPRFGAAEERLARQLTKRSLSGLFAEETPLVLLHMDYAPSNLLQVADGQIVTLDFEDARFGNVCFDLGAALFRFEFGEGPEEAEEAALAELIGSPRFDPFLEAYSATAPSWTLSLWEKLRRPALEWGCLSLAWHLARKSAYSFRYGRADRQRFARKAQRWWRQLARYAEAT